MYASRRNDILSPNCVSRLSAHLHYGTVSVFRIALEAGLSQGFDSKFLDELLTWREMSYAFCCSNISVLPRATASMLRSTLDEASILKVLPKWAHDTLLEHSGDARTNPRGAGRPVSLQDLSHAQSGDAVWDAAQRCLLRHGELHNNMRMTWAKAVLQWAPTPASALLWLLVLNDRYALDGCDPNSYSGILWCFGFADGPKEQKSTRITGSLRRRPTTKHSHQQERYARMVDMSWPDPLQGRRAEEACPTGKPTHLEEGPPKGYPDASNGQQTMDRFVQPIGAAAVQRAEEGIQLADQPQRGRVRRWGAKQVQGTRLVFAAPSDPSVAQQDQAPIELSD